MKVALVPIAGKHTQTHIDTHTDTHRHRHTHTDTHTHTGIPPLMQEPCLR